MSAIVDVVAREILDSRGNPTVEADVLLESGVMGMLPVVARTSSDTMFLSSLQWYPTESSRPEKILPPMLEPSIFHPPSSILVSCGSAALRLCVKAIHLTVEIDARPWRTSF